MPIELDDVVTRFPFGYHLTARANLARIKRTAQLESAAALMRAANRLDLLQVRRGDLVEINVNGDTVILRDHAVLHNGHIRFLGGWDLARFIESLNSRVFFWPGDDDGPIIHGQNHFGRYEDQQPAILCVPLQDVIAANPDNPPMFCPYNSGSPRTVRGEKSPRGPETFLPCDLFERRYHEVVEVTFENRAILPLTSTEVRLEPNGAWRLLSGTDV